MRRSSAALWLSGVAAGGLLLLAPSRASAWCRTTTNVDFQPTPEKPCDDVGKPIYWSSKCVGFSVQRDASVQVDLATARDIAQKAFNEWSKVDCPADPVTCDGSAGAGKPSITVRDLGPVDCHDVEYNGNKGNANVIMFRDESWPHEDPDITLALTTVTFSVDSGEIYDADMEINSSDPKGSPLTLKDSGVVYDFWSILTHETGHFLGLAHTQRSNTAATMYPAYSAGKTFMRDPSRDDICGICAAYPPDRVTVCSDTPRNGFALDCGGGEPATVKKGCHCAVVGDPASGSDLAFLGSTFALVVGLLRRRPRGSRRLPG